MIKTKTLMLLTGSLFFSGLSYGAAGGDAEQAPVGLIEAEMQTDKQPDNSDQQIKEKWDAAKDSTAKALAQSKEAGQAFWEASKESSKEIWSDSKALGQDVWDNVKEKSTDILEKGTDILDTTNDKIEGLLEKETENKAPEHKDESITNNII